MTKKTIVQRRGEPLFERNGEPTHRFIRFLEELNGNSNEMIDALTGFNEFDDLISESAKEQLLNDVVSTDVDYTTVGDQVIICTAALTVTLSDEPEDQERVKVIIANGDVTVSGNGKLINKKADVTIIFKNLVTIGVLDIIYILELDEWFIV